MKSYLKLGKLSGEVDTVGGELVSFVDDLGTEYIWQGDEKYWSGRTPVLFPIVGALKDSKTIIDGKEYTINKHGFARRNEFKLVELKDNSAKLEFHYNQETFKVYPYKFILTTEHKLDENGFTTTYTVKNIDSSDINFFLGGHPGFNVPLYNGDKFEDYKLKFPRNENCATTYCDSDSLIHDEYSLPIMKNTDTYNFNYNDFDIDVFILNGLKSKTVKVLNKKDIGFEFIFDGYKTLGVWTPPKKKAPFICLEPWVGLPSNIKDSGKFDEKPYMVSLSAGKTYSVSYSLKIIR